MLIVPFISCAQLQHKSEIIKRNPIVLEQEDLVEVENIPVELKAEDDLGLTLYRDLKTRVLVESFYANITGSAQIADVILQNADLNNIPVSLAFSLAYKESSYNPLAVNYNSRSIDRGLFQLNSRSFPKLTVKEFFSAEVSAREGLSYLSYCFKTGESDVVALAMYNAGRTRVTNDGTPLMTLDYISDILDYKEYLDKSIEAALVKNRTITRDAKEIKSVRYVLEKKKSIK